MTKHPHHKIEPTVKGIIWDRILAIFGSPSPPKTIWEKQFDGFDDQLRQLANTPHQDIPQRELWYYFHDLAYVELQPDLFDYLFPACLMEWHRTLMDFEPCSHGDAELHWGIHNGKVFEKMLTPTRQEKVSEFFRDSLMDRLDGEVAFATVRNRFPSISWIARFNSLGIVLPRIDLIWNEWWSLETPGRAIAALQYLSGLIYFDGDNPLFLDWRGTSPPLWKNDSFIFHDGWRHENADFLAASLTPEFVTSNVHKAVARLEGHPEVEKANRMESDLERNECQALIRERIAELPKLLRTADPDGWTV